MQIQTKLHAVAVLSASLLTTAAGALVGLRSFNAYRSAPLQEGQLDLDPYAKIAGPIIQVSPTIQISAPLTFRTDSPAVLSVIIGKSFMGHGDELSGQTSDAPQWLIDLDSAYTVTVAVPATLKAPATDSNPQRHWKAMRTMDGDELSWHWLLSADQPGYYPVVIAGLPLTTGFFGLGDSGIGNLRFKSRDSLTGPVSFVRLDGRTVSFEVRATTALGLSSRLNALLAGLAVILGVLGTVFSYPIWRRLWEQPNPESPARKPAAIITPDSRDISKYGKPLHGSAESEEDSPSSD